MKHEIFNKELTTIQDAIIREFATYLLDNAEDYFYEIPASTTGKYHPSYALGDGGLVRHTKALVGIMNSLFQLEQYQNIFTTREMDLLIVAGLVHDIEKCGNNGSIFTVFDHPILASDYVYTKWEGFRLRNTLNVTFENIVFIQEAIISHMGQWNTSNKSDIILPKPETEAQKLLHLCDYLASRKFLEYAFDESTQLDSYRVSLDEYRMTFGKYKNLLLKSIAREDFGYIEWLSNQDWINSILKNYVNELISNKGDYSKQ